jgi:O-succinylbenzoate synthase
MATDIKSFLEHSLDLHTLELIEVDIPQRSGFRSSIGVRNSRKALILRWTDQDGKEGYGECSCRPDPYYSSEFLAGVAQVIQLFLFPIALQSDSYGALLTKMQKVRGWPFAKAAVEMAAHDLLARKHGASIFDYWQEPLKSEVPVGISIGFQEDKASLERTIEAALETGYHRLKFKIGPRFDKEQIDTLLNYKEAVSITFDANGAFLKEDIDRLQPFLAFQTPIEQPFPPQRYDLYRAAIEVFPELTVCLDEEVKSLGQLIQAYHLGYVDELNIKPGRVGGLANSIYIADYCREKGVPCWVGGMFESGIGRSINLQFAARLNAPAHDLSPSGRYFKKDIVVDSLKMNKGGCIALEDVKNTEVDTAALNTFTTNKIKLTKG